MSFRLKGSPKRTTKLARQGLIEGGELHGCRYTFEGFSAIAVRGVPRLRVHLIINRDGWPFPEAVVLHAAGFRGLLPVKGARSQWIDAAPLMEAALQAGG
ncbi:hypothetical protein J2W28_002088 [Variovorax boronicumulans]|uniref:hypothetical protein n=1 Tax=Variovorax boronicumulans TaxID=436515 RepID=UPI00278A837E|nr:hypothetical protein [Variovorax boronicumulans]MDP9990918.1 hypothetical protein [Variovorax boronicumulans]MDQ0002946.1 hypothetical protein [Variovorax boronicumulans]